MSKRQEDFKRMAHSHDTESSKYEQQCYIDGAEDGYEYAVDKVAEYLLSALEHELGYFATGDFVAGVIKFMEGL